MQRRNAWAHALDMRAILSNLLSRGCKIISAVCMPGHAIVRYIHRGRRAVAVRSMSSVPSQPHPDFQPRPGQGYFWRIERFNPLEFNVVEYGKFTTQVGFLAAFERFATDL